MIEYQLSRYEMMSKYTIKKNVFQYNNDRDESVYFIEHAKNA